ncbi:MAG: hypothetical protein MJ198_04600 [Bacteroidales bacterium]|nr:hypothetical protein [Bacteroidales bacterium]
MRIYLSFVLIVLFSISCRESCRYNLYEIKNDSNYAITIVNYDYNGINPIIDTVKIAPKSSFCSEVSRNCKTPSVATNIFCNNYGVSDSIKIFFDTLRVTIFYSIPEFSEPRNRNLLDPSSCFRKNGCRKNNGCNYIYVITDEDYFVAEDL